MDDLTWRLVGFRRRPRRGPFFDRFVSSERLERETTLTREFLWLALAAMTRWVFHRSAQVESPALLLGRILELSIDGLSDPLWPVFRFKTREEALSLTSNAIVAYVVAKPADQGAGVFHHRISPILDDREHGVWLARSVMLCAGPQSVLSGAGLALDSVVGPGQIAAPSLSDERLYSPLAQKLLAAVSS